MYWQLEIARIACTSKLVGRLGIMAVAAIVGEPDRCQSCGEDIDEHTLATITYHMYTNITADSAERKC